MDIAWFIIDSLSFSATPFAEDGPETMPQLSELADERAMVFTNAYAPGPTSPSSHGSFFTGELPSDTGMHEAYPHFNGDLPTIATEISKTHESFLVTSNQFLFNGIDEGFDRTQRFGHWEPRFPTASNPVEKSFSDEKSTVKKYFDFVVSGGKPIRSILNGVEFKRSNHWGAAGNYAAQINADIRDFWTQSEEEVFIVANYMDVHAPLSAGEEAIRRFADGRSREELPVGVRGNDTHQRIKSSDDYEGEDMYALYKSAIWDLDREVTPLIEDLVDSDALVIVTADHGNWFRRKHELDEERIHVPLLVFSPTHESQRVTETVNLRSLPRTIMEVAEDEAGIFAGPSLTEIEEDQLSITEFIHSESETGRPISPTGSEETKESVIRQLAMVKNGVRVDYDGEKTVVRRGSEPLTGELADSIDNHQKKQVRIRETPIEYDTDARERLKNLGYIE